MFYVVAYFFPPSTLGIPVLIPVFRELLEYCGLSSAKVIYSTPTMRQELIELDGIHDRLEPILENGEN